MPTAHAIGLAGLRGVPIDARKMRWTKRPNGRRHLGFLGRQTAVRPLFWPISKRVRAKI
jgi:hypothetical protein